MDIDEMRRRYREKNGQQEDNVPATPTPTVQTSATQAPQVSNYSGEIIDTWVEHNVENDGVLGLKIHVAFSVNGLKNVECAIGVFFRYENGDYLKYNDNIIAVKDYFTPPYDECSNDDFFLFIPYDELYVGEKIDLKYDVELFHFDDNKVFSSSDFYSLPYSGFMGEIEKVWMEHNVQEDGQFGLNIHTAFSVSNLKGKECGMDVFFYRDNGEELKDNGGEWVSVYEPFKPSYDECRFDDFVVFVPYNKLYLNERGDLKYEISLFVQNDDESTEFYCSNKYPLPYVGYNGNIEKVWMDHNVTNNGIKGMNIHVAFIVDNLKDINCIVYALFNFANDDGGEKLKDSAGESIDVFDSFTPPYDGTRYDDFVLFLPYNKFNCINRKTDLKFDITLFVDNEDFTLICDSDYYNITYTP